ncbi:MAG: hypothetical protein L6Q81_07210 [Bacteroidia bacterium]|nr:hypothetical protein [Bacteroidia bacterium]
MAEKGKVKVIKDTDGGIVVESRTNLEYTFSQKNHKELCLGVGDRVKFDIVAIPGTTTSVAVNVERITAGTVLSFDSAKGTGTIEERVSKKTINFYEPYAKDMGIDVGDVVRYTLLNTAAGELAVNLTEVVE